MKQQSSWIHQCISSVRCKVAVVAHIQKNTGVGERVGGRGSRKEFRSIEVWLIVEGWLSVPFPAGMSLIKDSGPGLDSF